MRNITTAAIATGRAIAKHVAKEVREQVIKDIEIKAEQWMGENKLVHAGAARQLAEELKQKFVEKSK